jgi:hypothetical protein
MTTCFDGAAVCKPITRSKERRNPSESSSFYPHFFISILSVYVQKSGVVASVRWSYVTHPSMKHIFTGFNLIGAVALLALAASCTLTQRETRNKEKFLIAAGFKVIVPHTVAQQQTLKALPSDRVTLVQKDGKTYYVFPDAANNRAYVGGPTQYQAYKQIRTAIQFRNESLEAAGLGQETDWGTWEGWGGPGWAGLR